MVFVGKRGERESEAAGDDEGHVSDGPVAQSVRALL